MVYLDSAQKVIHVTLSGKMLGGAEEWQTGFYVGSPTTDAGDPTQAFADAIRDAWVTFFRDTTIGISNTYTFDQVKLARLNKNSLYDLSVEPKVSFPATSITGDAPGSPKPPQLALVATLAAGSAKGLGGKGRMYLPGIKADVDGSGHLDATYCQAVATKLATFFNTVNTAGGAIGRVVNVSRGHKAQLGAGARNVYVNGVRVGNVYDTQRRRRNALAETYKNAVVNDI